MQQSYRLFLVSLLGLGLFSISGCVAKPWPASPLYPAPTNDPAWVKPANVDEAKAAIAGRYAHYDVVAYEAETPNGPLSTLIVSYGFTEFVEEGDDLVEYDCFCHAEHKANQDMTTTMPDEATQAILPRSAVVDVFEENGDWKVYRPATPTLIGMDGDPDQPLSMDPNDPNINDPDGDNKPGITVYINLFGIIDAALYLARREIFENDLTLYSNGSLQGNVIDSSEQLVIGASLDLLNQPNNPPQWPDLGLSPLILVPIPEDIDTCEELMANRDLYFPPEPEF